MMKKFLLISFLVILFCACTPSAGDHKMKVTASSEKALALYNDAMVSYDEVNFRVFRDLAEKSLQEDPDFFMADFMLALSYLYSNENEKFNEYVNRAIACRMKLSKEELMLKSALKKYEANKKTDNTDIGRKLVSQFPRDVRAYGMLITFQYMVNDVKGLLSTLEKAVTIFKDQASLYNMLGYTYMNLGQNDKALAAFDKYLELAPNIPNSYDSKGDYFMHVKDYLDAYECYMKAYRMDSLWGMKKATDAKEILDSLKRVK